MAGGNQAAMQALMSAFSDGSPSYSGRYGSSGGNPLTEQYKAILKQWIADNERSLVEADSARLSNIVQGYEGMMQDPRLNFQQKNAYMQGMSLGGAGFQTKEGLSAALDAVNKLLQFTGQAGVPTDDIKTAQMLQQDPSLLAEMHRAHPSASARIADDLGLTGQERQDFILKHAMKSGVTINTGDGAPALNLLPVEKVIEAGLPPNTRYYLDKNNAPQPIGTGSESANKTKQHFDTMSNALGRLDELEKQVPDYNPAEFTDAMIRSLASNDSSLIGKVLAPLQSPASKLYGTAAAEWVSANRAILSGAEVPEPEFMRDLSIYFAKPGDTKEILAMKAQMRRDRLESLKSIVALPPDQRAAAWKATGDQDNLRLTGVSTSSPAKDIATGATGKPSVGKVLDDWEKKVGRAATPEEIAEIRARFGGQ